jgi:hypothetical protein
MKAGMKEWKAKVSVGKKIQPANLIYLMGVCHYHIYK